MDSFGKLVQDHGLALAIAIGTIVSIGWLFVQVINILKSFFKDDGVVTNWFRENAKSQATVAEAVRQFPVAVQTMAEQQKEQTELLATNTTLLQKISAEQTRSDRDITQFHCQAASNSGAHSVVRANRSLMLLLEATHSILEHYLHAHPGAPNLSDLRSALQRLNDGLRLLRDPGLHE